MDIQLNFINNSTDANNSDIVIFQRTANSDDAVIATRVLCCPPGSTQHFSLPAGGTMGATPVSTMQNAGLSFKPTIWVGAVPNVQEGDVANSDTLSGVNTEISLLGVVSADIIMTGAGTETSPFSFHVKNIVPSEAAKDSAHAEALTAASTRDIHLKFINNSNDTNNSDVVVFQKNTGPGGQTAVAWTVIRNCGKGQNHPFVYPIETTIAASDSWGNFTPQLQAENGQVFHMIHDASGDRLELASQPGSPNDIQLRNDLQKGAINAHVFKANRLLALKTGIAPAQKASFSFKPVLWIGVASQVEQGEVMDSAIAAAIETEISLLGIRSADIVMTGGGSGVNARPFQFELENVVYQ
jgi:hypothetical protein